MGSNSIIYNTAQNFLLEICPTFFANAFDQSAENFYVCIRSYVLCNFQALATFNLIEALMQKLYAFHEHTELSLKPSLTVRRGKIDRI